MGLDIKIPIGLLFVILGFLIFLQGLMTISSTTFYVKSLGYNVNLWTGGAMLIFGSVMLFFSKWKKAE